MMQNVMPKPERLRQFGQELRRRRVEAGYEDLKRFAARIGVSVQHLSQVETAYSRQGRAPVGLGDEAMEVASRILGWRVTDMRRMLGQIPEDEICEDGGECYSLANDVSIVIHSRKRLPTRVTESIRDFANYQVQKVEVEA